MSKKEFNCPNCDAILEIERIAYYGKKQAGYYNEQVTDNHHIIEVKCKECKFGGYFRCTPEQLGLISMKGKK